MGGGPWAGEEMRLMCFGCLYRGDTGQQAKREGAFRRIPLPKGQGWGPRQRLFITSHLPYSSRISDIRLFIVDARPAMAATSFVLMTTFPNKELADENQTLKEANLLNAVIVQRLT